MNDKKFLLGLTALTAILATVGTWMIVGRETVSTETGIVAEDRLGAARARTREVSAEQSGAADSGQVGARQEVALANNLPAEGKLVLAVPIEVQLVDAFDQFAIKGNVRVRHEGREIESASNAGGKRLLLPRTPEGALLVASAPGYQDAELTLPQPTLGSYDPVVVSLEPSLRVLLRAVDSSGTPEPDASILVHRSDSRGRPVSTATPMTLVTGPAGTTELRAGGPYLVGFDDEPARILVQSWQGSVDLVRESVGVSGPWLRFVDSRTGVPLDSLRVTVTGSGTGHWRPSVRRTTEEGTLDLSGGAGPWMLALDSAYKFGASGKRTQTLSSEGPDADWPIDKDGAYRVEVLPCGLVVECLAPNLAFDEDAVATYRVDSVRDNGETRVGRELDCKVEPQIDQGLVRLGCTSQLNATHSLVLSLKGFAPASFDGLAVSEAIADGRSLRVTLQPLPLRSVRVVSPEGSPIRAYARVVGSEGRVLFEGNLDHEGRTKAIGWQGGGWEIKIPKVKFFDDVWKVSIPPARFSDSSTEVVVELDRPSAVVNVIHLPPDPVDLILRTESSCEVSATRRGDILVFDQVPPGWALIGPRAWVDSLFSRSYVSNKDGWIQLGRGEHIIPWNKKWQLLDDLETRISFTGGALPGAFVHPIYGPIGGQTPIGVNMPQWGFTPGKSWSIPKGHPLPSLLLVCAAEPAGSGQQLPIRVLEDIVPGSDSEISLRSISLVWPEERPWPGEVRVSCLLPAERLRSDAGRTASQGGELLIETIWRHGEPLLLDRLTGGVAVVEAKSAGAVWKSQVSLRPGSPTQVIVDLETK